MGSRDLITKVQKLTIFQNSLDLNFSVSINLDEIRINPKDKLIRVSRSDYKFRYKNSQSSLDNLLRLNFKIPVSPMTL